MQTHNITTNHIGNKVVFMPSIHEEAMELLYDAQDYFIEFGDIDQENMSPEVRAVYSCEMSRITLRLSCVMEWLLAKKTEAATGEDYGDNLGFQDICLVDTSIMQGILPSYVCHLLDASLELYIRVFRLNRKPIVIH